MKSIRKECLLASFFGLVFAMGCSTTMELASIPDNAEVIIHARDRVTSPWVAVDQVTTPAVYQVRNNRQFFGHASEARINLLFSKDGYADHFVQPEIYKRKTNRIAPVELEPLNTSTRILTKPEGASVSFYANESDAQKKRNPIPIPMDNTLSVAIGSAVRSLSQLGVGIARERTTPMTLSCSPSAASRFFSSIRYVRIELEGYVPITEPFTIEPGLNTSIERNLVLAEVTLNIRSVPTGAVVEDWREAGFGRLGETDLQRVITYNELVRRPEFLTSGRLILNLRAFKDGHGEWTRDNIQIPLGDTYEIEFHLPTRMTTVRIDSEPAGASVYVMRRQQSDDLADRDPETGKGRIVEYKRHLGTTPFTYTIDSADPHALRHGDDVYFEKEGYKETRVKYVREAPVLHGKLDPERPAER